MEPIRTRVRAIEGFVRDGTWAPNVGLNISDPDGEFYRRIRAALDNGERLVVRRVPSYVFGDGAPPG